MHYGGIQFNSTSVSWIDHDGNLVPFPQLHVGLQKSVQKLVIRMSRVIRVSYSTIFIPSFNADVM